MYLLCQVNVSSEGTIFVFFIKIVLKIDQFQWNNIAKTVCKGIKCSMYSTVIYYRLTPMDIWIYNKISWHVTDNRLLTNNLNYRIEVISVLPGDSFLIYLFCRFILANGMKIVSLLGILKQKMKYIRHATDYKATWIVGHTTRAWPLSAGILPTGIDADMCTCGFALVQNGGGMVFACRMGGTASVGLGDAFVPLHGWCVNAFCLLKI